MVMPDTMIECHDPRGATPDGLQGVEAIPAADIEHAGTFGGISLEYTLAWAVSWPIEARPWVTMPPPRSIEWNH